MLQQTGLIIQYLILAGLCIQVGYLFFFAVAGRIRKPVPFPKAATLRRFRIFIPGYKEDSVIITTAGNAISQDYPKHLAEIVVIADSFSESTLKTLRSMPITVVEVQFEKSTKGKALQKAIAATAGRPADIVLILDADNHMAPGFLHAVNNAFERGYEVVQGHRTAKNLESSFAFLDACTEEINNNIFRRGHVAVGLPSALIGSGMAFDATLFASLLLDIGETAGEDKELEFRIMRLQKNVAFLDGAYVYDEKVSKNDVFSQQRSRWLAMQLEFFRKYFAEGWAQLFRGNIAFFNKVFQTYLFPRVMLVAAVGLWFLWVLIFSRQFLMISTLLLVALAFSLLIGIPAKWYSKNLLQAFLRIPGAVISMMTAVKGMGKAGKTFIHTPHGDAELPNK